MPKFPFTNYHELNLDWILKKVNALFDASEENARTISTYNSRLTSAEHTATSAETAASSAQQLADAAAATAGNALSVAGTADAKADSALTASTDARNAASNSLTIAQEAQQTAGAAVATANDAAATASGLESLANTANQNATAAVETAGTAVTTANNAATAANTADQKAVAAQQTANSAQSAASTNAGNISTLQTNVTDLNRQISELDDNIKDTFNEFTTLSKNLWINFYGEYNGVTFKPNGLGGLKITGTATATGNFTYTFTDPLVLNGMRLQYRQEGLNANDLIIRCRNASNVITRNLSVTSSSGFSVDSSTNINIKYLQIVVTQGIIYNADIYISLTETVNETVNIPRKLINAYHSETVDFIGSPSIDIDFWGDSLTVGQGGSGITYPNTCATLLNATYRNLGHGGESANTISAREGGNAWIIPAGSVNGDYTIADMNDVYGGKVLPLRQIASDATATRIIVNGIECTINRKSQTSPATDDVVYTVSGYNGDALLVPTPVRFIGSDYNAKVTVFFIGTNGQTVGEETDVNARITIIDSMIAHLKNKNYIVMGLSNGTTETRSADDAAMLKHYGNNFFPTRMELVNNGLTIQGLTPTANDQVYINVGTVPESLRTDATHLNAQGYNALGKLLAFKMRSLGYDKIINS